MQRFQCGCCSFWPVSYTHLDVYKRQRIPYVDIEPVSAAPLSPGGEADFRLILESVPDNWNMQTPGLRAIQVDVKQ